MAEYDESECIRQMTQIITAGDPSPASPAHDRASHIYSRMINPLMQEIPALKKQITEFKAENRDLARHVMALETLNKVLNESNGALVFERDRLIAANRQLRERQ